MANEKIEIVDNSGEVVEVNKKKTSTTPQFKNFTLRFPKYFKDYDITITEELIEKKLKEIGSNYFLILHDSDTDTYLHYHAVVILDKKKTQKAFLKYIVNSLCPFANFQLVQNLFEVKVSYSLYGSVQYLTHKNYEEKFQYPVNNIITNNWQLFNLYYNNGDTELTLEDIDNIILNSRGSYKFIIYKIGMKQFNKYYRVIDKLYKFYFGEKDLGVQNFNES